jgi:hypothetical protein
MKTAGNRKIEETREVITYTNQSMAKSNVTSCNGASIAVNTIMRRTKAADGTGAEDSDAAKDVKVTVTISGSSSFMPDICAMKIALTEINKAVPSMFMTPIGKTNLVILLSTRNFCSITWKVEGRAAALDAREKLLFLLVKARFVRKAYLEAVAKL